MTTLTILDNPRREDNPLAVVPKLSVSTGEYEYPEKALAGTWFRVFPKTGADHVLLTMLEHRRDKFAPAKGNGVLLSLEVVMARKRS